MAKKSEFDGLYQGLAEEHSGMAVAYTRNGNYSVFIDMKNPVDQYCANIESYYNACTLYESIVKTVGDGYAIQKQDIFSRQVFEKDTSGLKFLSRSYMKHFEGREYTDIRTCLIITQELKRSGFNLFDRKRWDDFWIKVQKILDLLTQHGVKYRVMDTSAVTEYLHRFLGVSFRKGAFSFENFKTMEGYVKMGDRAFKIVDMVDIDEVIMPAHVKPYAKRDNYPQDLLSFLATVPDAESVIFTQTLIVPNQRKETSRLNANKNRKKNIKDPANLLAAKDIENLMDDIARDNKMLVYSNYTVMITVKGGAKELERPFNYVEKGFYDVGVGISKSAYNQLELFISSFPGNEYALKDYERFLCPHDAAVCFMFKESMKGDEDTPFKIYYSDRQGVPRAIDLSGKEGKVKYTTNSNFFSLGPSGSGKSFHMNSVVRQMYEQDTDIVMVDTGNSYEGLCSYVGGRYIAYTEEKPITMNPFRITERENNIEKQNFLKSLVFLIWKGPDAVITKTEDALMSNVIETYYNFYFHPFDGFKGEKRTDLESRLLLEARTGKGFDEYMKERGKTIDKIKKLENLAARGEGGEVTNANLAVQVILEEHGVSRMELENPDKQIQKYVAEEIQSREMHLSNIKVTELSFNSFYEFCMQYIPLECQWNGLSFNMADFSYAVKLFYRGGKFEKTLNDDFDNSLFEEKFIVFEIDAIKDDPLLFPIVTLIIMDVFIQKMRLKKNRKALIIEEAWKAIASPLMAGYIKYLYKTVRKFWGIVGVVTQELDDIISNATVKDAIVNNSEITILLDQSKFKERYEEIARMLGLSAVEQTKIWSINNMDNKQGRAYFKEVYIRRGSHGEVYGVEESPECYMAYTTERLEKDALKTYVARYGGDYEQAIDHFCKDWKKVLPNSGKADEYASVVNAAVKVYNAHYINESEAEERMLDDWRAFDEQFRPSLKRQVFCKTVNDNKAIWKKD